MYPIHRFMVTKSGPFMEHLFCTFIKCLIQLAKTSPLTSIILDELIA